MNKKIMFLAMMLLSGFIQMSAQDDIGSILSDGKVWIWTGYNIDHSEFPVYFTVVGTEEIDGKTCWRVDKTPDIPTLSGQSFLLHEENGKLSIRYEDSNGNVSWLPLMDFSMRVGEEREIGIAEVEGVYEPHSGDGWKVIDKDKVVVDGEERERMKLAQTPHGPNAVWVEGIGVPYFEGLLTWFWYPLPDNGIVLGEFKECQLNGKTIFTRADFGDINSVEEITDKTDADAPVYDLMGRRVTTTLPGSVYIRDGRKFIGK